MPYYIEDIENNGTYQLFHDSHITVNCTFESSGESPVPVDVISPVFKLYKDEQEVTGLFLLKPLQKIEAGTIGKYVATFLSNDLSAGDYEAKFTGTHNSTLITITGTLSLQAIAVKRTQWFIDELHIALGNWMNLEVPKKMLTFDPTQKQWRDGELFSFLNRAVNDANHAVPYDPNNIWDLETIPITNLTILGGQLYALMSAATLEATNYFRFTGGAVSIDFFKGDKYQGLMSYYDRNYLQILAAWKAYYVWRGLQSQAVVLRRIPLRVMRPMSLTAHYQHTFGA